MRLQLIVLGGATWLFACSSDSSPGATIGGGGTGGTGSGGLSGSSGNGGSIFGAGGSDFIDFPDAGPSCQSQTCAELGWPCGYIVDACDNITNCADEGRTCAENQICVGGIDGPTQCVTGQDPTCEVCDAVPSCDSSAPTRLTGRVITPGRTDDEIANQVGVPNATVYILRSTDAADLPDISVGVPADGQSCDRCEDQDLGPLLTGAITDAAGNFVLEGNIPVGRDFLLVTKVGKFRRATTVTQLPTTAACTTTALPSAAAENPTRLPRSMSDGLAVNLPSIAISTGQIDAMECVFAKMGLATAEFGNFGSASRIHLYRGGAATDTQSGARIDDDTPYDADLYTSLPRMQSYDMVVADCEGLAWDAPPFPQRVASGANIVDYVNRGGRMFASHLSFSWLHENGTTPYSDNTPFATGLGPAGTWDTVLYTDTTGTGQVSLDRPLASPRIENFAAWMRSEGVINPDPDPGPPLVDADQQFTITDPRSMSLTLGEASEEFVFRSNGNGRVQQFSFNTPYAAPAEDSCGRISYSGFHVAATGGGSSPFANAEFPAHCAGNLTNQEKVLLYMLFDLGACVGDEPLPPPCVPVTCGEPGERCGYAPDGCGQVLDCGACRPPPPPN
jgi:hypothetical protein